MFNCIVVEFIMELICMSSFCIRVNDLLVYVEWGGYIGVCFEI